MANKFLTPDIIAREALMVLRNNAVMAGLVHRDYSDEFVAGVGDTVTIRKPAKFQANEFNGSISVQDAQESGIAVKMDKLLDVSFAVTSKQLSMDIADFSKQLLVPAMQAFRDKIDNYLIKAAADAVEQNVSYTSGTDNIRNKVVDARKYLTDAAAPLENRYFVYGSGIEADLLKTDLFLSADKVGDEGTALREASLGRKFGMDFFADQNIDSTGSKVDGLVFHKNALALVTRQLELPQGASNSAIVNYDGFGLRVVYGYDMNSKTDTISIDMLCGVAVLDKDIAATINNTTPSVTISGTKTVEEEATTSLTATTVPAGETVTWASDNTSVATVSSGTVTGVAEGKANISASITVDGVTYTDSVEVTVTAKSI